jgi:antitoxin component YwqK of YwqJK toxin-antitoxin module/predicted negative regulator of RcsB-dependent stress response
MRTFPSRTLLAVATLALTQGLTMDPAHAQSKLPELRTFPTGAELLESGHALNREEKLADALAKYAEVNVNDTTYEDAQLEIGVLHYKQKEYDKSEQAFLRGWAVNGELAHIFAKNLGLLYSEQKKFDQALAWLDARLKDFPKNTELLYTKAGVLENKGDHKAALETYMECARTNPYFSRTHQRICIIALNEGALAQAALAQFFYLYVTDGGDDATNALAWLNEFLRGSVETEPKKLAIPGRDAYAEVDLLLENRVALSKDYKAYKGLMLAFPRQYHLLVDQLAKDPPTGDFFSDYYLPVFLQFRTEGLEEGFLYHCLGYSGNEDHQKEVKKNAAKRDKFYTRAADILREMRCTFPEELSTGKQDVYHAYKDDALMAYGPYDKDSRNLVGESRFYHPNGRVASEGRFDKEGRRQGLWTYYHANGKVRSRDMYTDDELNGLYVDFYDSGVREDSANFKAGKVNGPYYEHSRSGGLRRMRTFNDEGANGPSERYYQCGSKEYDITLKDGNAEGAVTGYYADGKKEFEGTFAADKRNGVNRNYDREGRISSEVSYVDGLNDGPFKYYHSNGKLRLEGQSKAGEVVGERRSYHPNGELEEVERFNEKGKAQGVSQEFDADGKLTYETTWENGKMMSYKYYDKAGAVIKEARRQKGAFDFVGYFANGAKATEGRYRDGEGKEGEWVYYWEDGSIRSRERFQDGNLHGRVDNYHRSGDLSSSFTYENGEETGPYCYYHPNGAKRDEGMKVQGELHGERILYRADGTVERREFYQNGVSQGIQIAYDPDGRVVDKTWYDRDIFTCIVSVDTLGRVIDSTFVPAGKDHVVKGLQLDGKVRREHSYRNRIAHGPYKAYHPNGKVSVEGQFVNGDRHGEWKFYYHNGKLSGTAVYDLGTLHGPDVDYYENGNKKSEVTFVHGQREGDLVRYHENGQVSSRVPQFFDMDHGTATYYTDKGEVEMVRYYFMDRLVGYSYEGADGKLVDTIPVVNETGRIETKFRNGKTARIMDLKNGYVHGDLIQYGSDGKLLGKRSYVNGDEHGTSELYHANGQLRFKGTYICGQADGEHLSYYDTGKVRQRALYRSGDQHGITLRYDRTTGKVTEQLYYRNDNLLSITAR